MASAISSGDAHRSITSRKVFIMGKSHKDNLSFLSMPKVSHDSRHSLTQNTPMSDASGTDYKAKFLQRTKEAREKANFTQEQIAKVLQITQDTYKQYEIRSLLPHRYIGAFCAATRVSETWLLTGQGSARSNSRNTEARTG